MPVAGDNEKRRKLYLAKSLAELNGQLDPGDKIKSANIATVSSTTLQKLYDSAKKADSIDKDDELSYILYMRFVLSYTLYNKTGRPARFSTESNVAIKHAEELANRLGKRYAMAAECEAAEAKVKELELEDATRNFNKNSSGIESKPRLAVVNGVIPSLHHEVEITPEELKTLMDQKSTRFLLIDTRSPADFKSSHPLHRDAICISNVFLVKGISANTLTTKLKQSSVESLELWNIRATFDLIILYDWMNSFEQRESTVPLFVLYDVITQWDPNTTYKGKIRILQGGFRHFYRKYPTYFTNVCPINGQLEEFCKSSASGHASLSGIEYPSLDNAPPPPPPVTVKPPLQPITNGELVPAPIIQKPTNAVTINPTINRATKPTHHTTIDTESKPSAVVSTSPAHEPLQPKARVAPAPSIPQVHAPIPPPSSLKPAAFSQNTATTKDDDSIGISSQGKPEVNGVMDSPSKEIKTEKLKTDGEQRSNSSLKRSQSNPNLNMIQGPDDLPPFSRMQKPQVRRDFPIVPVSSTRHHRTGLKNLGNSCYMNSIIQCLSHTRDLADFLTSDLQRRGFDQCGEVTKEVAMTIQQLSRGVRSYAPEELKRIIAKHYPSFAGKGQHDSHELLTYLLDGMHEELNKAPRRRHKLQEQKNENVPIISAYDVFREDYLSVNNSVISKLFAGEQTSTIRCKKCSKMSVTFEPFYFLSIPIPDVTVDGSCALEKCLDLYTQTEKVDMECSQCKTFGQTEKYTQLWRMPPYLLIHFKRFFNTEEHNGNYRKKITKVSFPLDNLDITDRVKGPTTATSTRYQLYAVSNHYGSMEGGHYTAFCRNPESWTKFDDADTSLISHREIISTAAYILFYQAREDD